MIIECPYCGAKHSLDENALSGKSQLQGKCAKCQRSFSVNTPTVVAAAYGAPAQPAPAVEKTQLAAVNTGVAALPEGKTVALSVIAGPSKGQVFRLDKAQVTIGRYGTDIVLNDPEISRKHCSLIVHGTSAVLTDLGTTNGTFMDGQRITTHDLQHLSEFHIGSSTVLLTITATPADEHGA